jgi:hypothetical protein
VSLECDERRGLGALALEVCGSAGANRFLAAHLSQGMQLAFLRLDGTLLRIAQAMLELRPMLCAKHPGTCSAGEFINACDACTDVTRAARTSLATALLLLIWLLWTHVLAGNYCPLTAQLVTFWRFAAFSISAKLATVISRRPVLELFLDLSHNQLRPNYVPPSTRHVRPHGQILGHCSVYCHF